MFTRNVKNGRQAGSVRFGPNDRPMTLPDFMRSDPDGTLATMYKRVKTASARSKLPTQRNRHEVAKRRPMTDEYAHVRSPVGDYIRGNHFRLSSGEQKGKMGVEGAVPVAEAILKNPCNITQNAPVGSCHEGDIYHDCREIGLEIVKDIGGSIDFETDPLNLGVGISCPRTDLELIFDTGIAELQQCKSVEEAFSCFAGTFHNVLEHVSCKVETSNVSTQTSNPKLRRSQMNFIYAGPWESCTWRQHQAVQTDEQNLTLMNQPTAMVYENSCCHKTNLVKQLLDWKFVGIFFIVSFLLLGLIEILNFV